MKKLIILTLAGALCLVLNAQNTDSIWIVNNYTKIERMVPMRDGIKLFTSIYMPGDTSERHPILMERTPYSCAPYGEDHFKQYWYTYLKYYMMEGYIMVTQDVRGRWMSEGEFVDVRPFIPDKKTRNDIDESSDTYDAIDWLVKNIPYNNGRVGVFGISYPGFYSTMAAASNHPALVAVSPQAPVTNWFIGDDFHHNGAFFILDAFSFYPAMGASFGVTRHHPTTVYPHTIDVPVHDNYKFYLETGALPAFARLAGDSVPFWKDLYSHPDYDDWWKARDARNATKSLMPAMLWIGGLFDAEDNWGAWNSYKAAEANNPGKEFNKIVMGPWYHVQWATGDGTHLGNIEFGSNTSIWYQQNIEIPFFNYFLKGKGNKPEIAEATVFITGENTWNKFDSWPPAGTENRNLYLQTEGKLSWQPPLTTSGFSEYTSDPLKPVPYTEDVHFARTREYMTDDQRFADRRPDVLSFSTDILDNDVTVTGVVTADLFVSISTTDADFVVKLIDIFPDDLSYNEVNIYSEEDPVLKYPMGGYEMLVHGEVFRGRYRNSFEKPVAFTPGRVEEVKFNVGDVAHTFKKGHRIMIQIQSTWFPLVDRNPQKFVNIYEAKDSDFQKATIRVWHNTKYPGKIVMPVSGSY
jgi:putative CocE/NonD family hydrolase